jgi:pyruvate dehydrogenase E2 component (dihydrolipoamide acetyltransferase)
VEGTGVRGRVMRADVSAYADVSAHAEGTAASGRLLGTKIPMSTVRKVIGRRMSESAFTAPHIYFFSDVWMDPLLEFREKVVSDFEKHFSLRPSSTSSISRCSIARSREMRFISCPKSMSGWPWL